MSDKIHIPLSEGEAVALLGRVKPTKDMPRQGAHAMKANPKPSRAIQKVTKRRAVGLCGACGKNPCECKRYRRKQSAGGKLQSPDLSRKR
jgi:hypothetical protein